MVSIRYIRDFCKFVNSILHFRVFNQFFMFSFHCFSLYAILTWKRNRRAPSGPPSYAIDGKDLSIMWIANEWNDYEVLDTSGGEKLERWGDYLLVRPDPQVIWTTPKTERGWKHPNGPLSQKPPGRR